MGELVFANPCTTPRRAVRPATTTYALLLRAHHPLDDCDLDYARPFDKRRRRRLVLLARASDDRSTLLLSVGALAKELADALELLLPAAGEFTRCGASWRLDAMAAPRRG